MSQDRANVNPLAVVVDGGDEPNGIACDVEDRQLANLIRTGEQQASFSQGANDCRLERVIPVLKTGRCIRMPRRELAESFARDDVHRWVLTSFDSPLTRPAPRGLP